MPPRWTRRACLIAFLVGLALVIFGPMLVYALGSMTAASPDPEAVQTAIKTWWTRLWWIAPLGGGLLFSGGIGLLFLWITRLASDTATTPKGR